jgi:hypothetical protein
MVRNQLLVGCDRHQVIGLTRVPVARPFMARQSFARLTCGKQWCSVSLIQLQLIEPTRHCPFIIVLFVCLSKFPFMKLMMCKMFD